MLLPPVLEKAMLDLITNLSGRETTTLSCRPVSGGSINSAAAVSGGGMSLFVKWNHSGLYPGMFEAEAKGLKLLADPGGVLVPEVYECSEAKGISWLAMEMTERGPAGDKAAGMFGMMLANLHGNTESRFGLDHHNFMGSLIQRNDFHDNFPDFYIEQRLQPQLKMAVKQGSLSPKEEDAFFKLCKELPSVIPEEPPSLVHGDLWCGNYISGTANRTWLIDPAVAYNHRETDIAMSMLFGGFPRLFYEAYRHHFPLAPDWEQRVEIFQLYPLLIHVNLFGGGYVGSVRSILRKFG